MNRDDRLFAIIGVAVVAIAAGLVLVTAGGITGVSREPERTVVAPLPSPDPTPVPGVVQASLELEEPGSRDELVRRLAAGISAHPEWARWLVTDDLIRRFVAAVDAAADGYSPDEELGFTIASGPFLVREDDDRLVIAAGTYRRANRLIEVLASIDAEDAVTIYHELEPELEAAHREIAFHRGTFEARLREAVDHLLEVEVPEGPIEVERRTTSYVFADDRLERLSNVQRQLVRMGPGNAGAVQDALRAIRAAFEWPEPPSTPGVATALADGDTVAPASLPVVAELGAESEGTPVFSGAGEPMLSPFDPRVAERDFATSPRVMTSMP